MMMMVMMMVMYLWLSFEGVRGGGGEALGELVG